MVCWKGLNEFTIQAKVLSLEEGSRVRGDKKGHH